MKGGNGKVAFIDRGGTFQSDHIALIVERFGMDAGAALDNIMDSVMPLFRVEFMGRGELAASKLKLAQISRLTKTAEDFNVAVYMTNQAIADPGGGVCISDPKEPAGGHVPAHATNVRLMLRKGKGELPVFKNFIKKFQSLTGIKGISEAKVNKIWEVAEKLLKTAVVKNSTGSQALNELTRRTSWIETLQITEALGVSGVDLSGFGSDSDSELLGLGSGSSRKRVNRFTPVKQTKKLLKPETPSKRGDRDSNLVEVGELGIEKFLKGRAGNIMIVKRKSESVFEMCIPSCNEEVQLFRPPNFNPTGCIIVDGQGDILMLRKENLFSQYDIRSGEIKCLPLIEDTILSPSQKVAGTFSKGVTVLMWVDGRVRVVTRRNEENGWLQVYPTTYRDEVINDQITGVVLRDDNIVIAITSEHKIFAINLKDGFVWPYHLPEPDPTYTERWYDGFSFKWNVVGFLVRGNRGNIYFIGLHVELPTIDACGQYYYYELNATYWRNLTIPDVCINVGIAVQVIKLPSGRSLSIKNGVGQHDVLVAGSTGRLSYIRGEDLEGEVQLYHAHCGQSGHLQNECERIRLSENGEAVAYEFIKDCRKPIYGKCCCDGFAWIHGGRKEK